MNAKILILFLLCTFSAKGALTSEELPFQQLPSAQTEELLQQLPPSESLKPGTRARPTDVNGNDRPQKLPIGSLGLIEISILALLAFAYAIYSNRKTMRKLIKSFFIIGLLCFATTANAQNAIKAVPDNYYINPGGVFMLDVTVNDDPGRCANSIENLVVELIDQSNTGDDITWSLSGNRIRVVSKAHVRGHKIIRYKITCKDGGVEQSSSTSVYVNFAERPDFVDAASCTVAPPDVPWNVTLKAETSRFVHFLASPLVGDLDGVKDASGKTHPEIVVFSRQEPILLGGKGNISDSIMIFNHDLTLRNTFPIKNTDETVVVGVENYFGHPFALGDVDQDGYGEIIVATSLLDGHKLRCYDIDGNLKWVSNDGAGNEESYWSKPMSDILGSGATPVIADIDGDGEIEIFVGDRIFDGYTGELLAALPEEAQVPGKWIKGRGHRQQTNTIGGGTYQPVLADINGDGKMDVVAGNSTYDVTINRENPALSVVFEIAHVDAPDGLTSVADIDGDGILDVIVVASPRTNIVMPSNPPGAIIATTFYVWQGSSGNFIGTLQYPPGVTAGSRSASGSRAFIGDIDGDGKPEICFTTASKMHAYKYNGTDLVPIWNNKTTTDTSGATTMTMFDFNLDGESELVYRDETHIRILDKNGNNVKDENGVEAIFDCRSATHTEYPVVVDLDGDGHAEILVSGARLGAVTATETRLMVFTSKTPDIWAPARSVWNQHGYNPLYVNEDLSIPQFPLGQQTETIYASDGSIHKPFNSFLEQAGWLNMEGQPLGKAADLTFELSRNQKMSYNEITDVMTMTAYVTNAGSKDFTNGDILLSLYAYTEASSSYYHVKSVEFTAQNLEIYGSLALDIVIPNFSMIPLPAYDNFFLSINLENDAPNAPKPFYKNQRECNSWNNMTARISYISGYVVLCKDDSAVLRIEPEDTYDCHWYVLNESGAKVPYPSAGNNIGDFKTVTKKTDDDREFFLIDLFKKGTNTPVTTASDSVFIYQSMDTLVWNGSVNSDWHNVRNWDAPNDPTNEKRIRYIPGSCTNILIPKMDHVNLPIANFPELEATSTNYKQYIDPLCNNISFEHVAEVSHIDKLKYSKAFIQLDIKSNRWYCLAPPLRDFYTGDIYKSDPNPFNDDIFVYTRLLSQTDPEYGKYVEGDWGRAFATPTHTFAAGNALGLWIDDNNPDITSHIPEIFEFPKYDPSYLEYNYDGTVQSGPHPVPSLANKNRFIFEESIDASGTVKLRPLMPTAGKDLMIGNPFMAHLDFEKFYNANSTLIEPRYRIIEQDGTYATYYLPGGGASTGNPILTQHVPPMQAIILTAKAPITAANPLIAKGSMTMQKPASSLRSSKVENKFFRIGISDTKLRSKTSLIVDPSSKTTVNYNAKLDAIKMLQQGDLIFPNIYLITADNNAKYTDIKTIASLDDISFKIGFAVDKTGPMALNFENLNDFMSDYYIYLEDKYDGKHILLNQFQNVYCFNKTTTNRFTDDRFVLKFSKTLLGVEETHGDDSAIEFRTMGKTLFVYTVDQSSLKNILIYDIQGRLITNSKNSDDTFSISLPDGVYVVRATSNKTNKTFKTIIK